uniref:Uncharacterized protein n=1 Tax=Magallana gigas TaxID=29159 RepID=A0A8W8JBJ5_MAGGI|nr:uncharacterized protein LOC117691850 [Crassostrea gigas]
MNGLLCVFAISFFLVTTNGQCPDNAESLESLKISLAVFVGISTILTILNTYFFIKLRLRDKSRTKTDIPNVIISHRGGNEPNAETYTELGNMASGDSVNQYESISRQENNINTTII